MRAALLGCALLAGCGAAPLRTIEYHLVDAGEDFARGVPAAQLSLSLAVCSGRVIHESDPAPGGLTVDLPEALQRAGTAVPIVFQPEMTLSAQTAVLYQAREQDQNSPWSLHLDGQALRLVSDDSYRLSGPGWSTELRFSVVDGEENPRIDVAIEPGGKTLTLKRAGYLWIGPRLGWNRHATGTLVAITVRKRADR